MSKPHPFIYGTPYQTRPGFDEVWHAFAAYHSFDPNKFWFASYDGLPDVISETSWRTWDTFQDDLKHQLADAEADHARLERTLARLTADLAGGPATWSKS